MTTEEIPLFNKDEDIINLRGIDDTIYEKKRKYYRILEKYNELIDILNKKKQIEITTIESIVLFENDEDKTIHEKNNI